MTWIRLARPDDHVDVVVCSIQRCRHDDEPENCAGACGRTVYRPAVAPATAKAMCLDCATRQVTNGRQP